MRSLETGSALIFKVNQLGDNIVFLPVVQRLVAKSVFSPLTLWTTPLAAPLYRNLKSGLRLALFSSEDFYPAWKSPAKLARMVARARSAKADIALVSEDMGNTAYLLALLSGARLRVGSKPLHLKIPFAINRQVLLDPKAPAAEKSWSLGRALAGSAQSAPWPEKPTAPDLTHLISPVDACDILIHGGASRPYQRWPLECFRNLAERLSKDFRVGWIELPEEPVTLSPRVRRIHSPRLEDLVSQMASASLFIGNNSGPMNIASALGIPSVIIAGPSSRSWDPYWHSDRFRVLRNEDLPCISCDPPGLPPRNVCTNIATPMACMSFWTIDRVEVETRTWFAKWITASGRGGA